jgi:DnaJ-class molecular chaperone
MNKYYDTLGIETGATEEQVKKAYKKMALKVHPDSGGTTYLFQQVNEAYTKIIEKIKKKKKVQKTKKNVQKTKKNVDVGINFQENSTNQFLSSPFDNDFFKNFDSNFDLDFPFKYSNSNTPLSTNVNSSYYSESTKSQYKNGKTIKTKIINDNGKIYEQIIKNKQ